MPPRFRRVWQRFDLANIEYDAGKSRKNLAERGFDFAFAARIFQGEVLDRLDTRHRQEARHQAIGESMGFVLFVVYTVRNGQCRIISGRLANPDEVALYHGR